MKNTIIANLKTTLQLTERDMTNGMTWDKYQKLCTDAIRAAYELTTQDLDSSGENERINMLYDLLCVFDESAAKAMRLKYQHRIVVACLDDTKKVKSDEYIAENKAKTTYTKRLADYRAKRATLAQPGETVEIEDPTTGAIEKWDAARLDDNIAKLEKTVEGKKACIDTLKTQPGNFYNGLMPRLKGVKIDPPTGDLKATRDKIEASDLGRKMLENAIADILGERKYMSAADLERERALIEADRKTRKAHNKKAAAAQKNAENK